MEAPFERRFRLAGLSLFRANQGERLLEIGFGTGQCLEELALAVGTSGRVAGIDLSSGMRDVAMRRLHAAGLDGRTDLRLGDAAALQSGYASFDGVFMSFTLELFDTPEIPVVLAECRRVIHEEGRMVACPWRHRSAPGSWIACICGATSGSQGSWIVDRSLCDR